MIMTSLFFCNLFSSPIYQKACSRTTVLLPIYSKNIRLSICKSNVFSKHLFAIFLLYDMIILIVQIIIQIDIDTDLGGLL